MTDANGAASELYAYSGFGQPLLLAPDGVTKRDISAIGNTITYTGREWDAESGLYYFRARYLDPGLGRFLSRDPFVVPSARSAHSRSPFAGVSLSGMEEASGAENRYCYVANNPLVYVDPSGMKRKATPPSKGPQGTLFTPCCNGIRYNPFFSCCENKKIVSKQKIWICERRLAMDNPDWCTGTELVGHLAGKWFSTCLYYSPHNLLTPGNFDTQHSYVCCNGENKKCYGKQSNTLPGQPIPVEQITTGRCYERKVCPALKKSKCQNPKCTKPYGVCVGENCHDWAWKGIPE